MKTRFANIVWLMRALALVCRSFLKSRRSYVLVEIVDADAGDITYKGRIVGSQRSIYFFASHLVDRIEGVVHEDQTLDRAKSIIRRASRAK